MKPNVKQCKLTENAIDEIKKCIGLERNGKRTTSYDLDEIHRRTGVSLTVIKNILGQNHLGDRCQFAAKTSIERILRELQKDGFPSENNYYRKGYFTCDGEENNISEINEKNCILESEDLVLELRESIKHSIIERCESVKIIPMAESLNLKDVYVHPKTNTDPLNLSAQDKMEYRFSTPEPFVKELDEEHIHIIVTGRIGTGKSTFLKRLALMCIDPTLMGDYPKDSFLHKQIPVHILLRQFIDLGKGLSFLDFIERSYNLEKGKLALVLEDETSDKCLFLFDGLDQVEDKDKTYLMQSVIDFIQKYPRNDYVISSRRLVDSFLLESFEIVELSPLDKSSIEKFIENYFKVIPSSPHEYQVLLKYLENEDNKQIMELCTNPLILTLVSLEFNRNGIENIAKNKWKIIQNLITEYLINYDDQRNIKLDDICTNYFIENLLAYIAYKIFEEGRIYLSKERLTRYIREYIENKCDSEVQKYKDHYTNIILKTLESSHITVFIKSNSSSYCFLHQLYREYFCFLYIIRNYDSASDFRDFISSQKENSNKWTEVLNGIEEVYESLLE